MCDGKVDALQQKIAAFCTVKLGRDAPQSAAQFRHNTTLQNLTNSSFRWLIFKCNRCILGLAAEFDDTFTGLIPPELPLGSFASLPHLKYLR